LSGGLDDKKYWIDRHKKESGRIASVGSISYSEKANYFIYKILTERYKMALGMLDIPKDRSALDAGCGIGIFSEFLASEGFKVTAADISQDALDRIKNDNIQKICSPVSEIDTGERRFDLVHSFDVLYHILDDKEWERSLENICRLSKRYVALHERFFKTPPVISSAHLKARTIYETAEILNRNGFYEVLSVPTHMIALRLLTFKISKYFPETFYKTDRFLLSALEKRKIRKYGSHFIKIFEKKQ
jgi:SAM-dependent methyltransferase